MAARRSATQLLPARSIHLRIVPRPTNLSESREIFRVLQRFGEISVFKNLRYEYHNPADNIALAIFRDAAAAQKALDASPIRFALEKVLTHPDDLASLSHDEDEDEDERMPDTTTSTLHPTTPKTGIDEILRPSTLSTRTSPTPTPSKPAQDGKEPPMPFQPPAAPRTRTKWFQIIVDRSRAVHQDFVERQPYWKHFHPMKSVAQEDLAKSVPHPGLSDVSKRPLNQHRTPNKVLKGMSEYVEKVMPSLRGVYMGAGREEEFERRNNS